MIDAPFVGFRPYKRQESKIFMGREDSVVDLMELFIDQRLVTLVGGVGAGKTSLINAGFIPCLLEGALGHFGRQWQIAEMRPGKQPFKNLADALCSEQALDTKLHAIPLDEATLQGSPTVLHDILTNHPFLHQHKLLIVCDQFEEIFWQQDEEEAKAFIELLVASSLPHHLPFGEVSNNIYVLISLRSGYLKHCNAFDRFAAVLHKGLYSLPELNHEQLIRVIEKPIQMFGGSIEQELTVQLLEDMAQSQLPLLQLVLWTLWKKSSDQCLTIFDYYVIGGLKKVLSNHADQLFQNLTNDQQQLAKLLFKALFIFDEQGDARGQPVKFGTMVELAKVDKKAIRAVLDIFRQESGGFMKPSLPHILVAETEIDIAYDCFCRQWYRLEEWFEEEAKAAGYYKRLRKAALQYQAKRGDLLPTSELETIWQWYQESQPTALWSQRYGGDFSLSEAFLQKSKKVASLKKISAAAAVVLGIVMASMLNFDVIKSYTQAYFSYPLSKQPPANHVTVEAKQSGATVALIK